MPYKTTSVGKGKVKVTGPGGVHAKATTPAKAAAQIRLLHGVEHGMKPRTTREVIGEYHSEGNPHPKHKRRKARK
ncbi:hypothetical protein LCGC14_1402740 [marine sediment metagenome]|uniref:Uncharacterized protein n=1 Tax=marine sediment metagenome TaxID=412755 RepID=A0A0F9JWU3_9ZZZZ